MPAWRKYSLELLAEAVAESTSIAGVLRYLGLAQAGGTHAHISRTIKRMGLDTSHFAPYRKSGGQIRRMPPGEILVRRPPGSGRQKPPLLRRALVESGVAYACAECGNSGIWRKRLLRLHVDHIDGDFHNNTIENLRFLCPNCHSQTENFSGLSRGKYTGSYTRVDRRPALRSQNEEPPLTSVD